MSNKIKKKLNTFTLILLAAVLFVSCPLIAYAAALQSNFSLGGSITYEYKNKINYEYLNATDFFYENDGGLYPNPSDIWLSFSTKTEGTEYIINLRSEFYDAEYIAPDFWLDFIYIFWDRFNYQSDILAYVTIIFPEKLDATSIGNIFTTPYDMPSVFIDTLIFDWHDPQGLAGNELEIYSTEQELKFRQLFIGDESGADAWVNINYLPDTIETFVCEIPISQVEDYACSGCRALSVFDADLSGCGYIGYQAFYNCVNMPMPIDITPGTTIEQDAFANVCFPRKKIRNTDTGKIHDGYIVDGSTIDALINGFYNNWQQAISFVPDYVPPSIITSDDYMEFMIRTKFLYQPFRLYTDSVIYITYEAIERLNNEMQNDFELVLNMLDAFYLSDISLAYTGSFEISTAAYATGLGHFYQLPYANVLVQDPTGDIAGSVIPQLFANDYNYLTDARYIDNLDENLDTAFDLTRNENGEPNGVVYTRENYPVWFSAPTFEYVEEYSYPVIRNYVDYL